MIDKQLKAKLSTQMKVRMSRLQQEIHCNVAAIQHLLAVDRGEVSFKGLGYARRYDYFRRTAVERKRMFKTIANLKLQNALMQHEITVLQQVAAYLGLSGKEVQPCQ